MSSDFQDVICKLYRWSFAKLAPIVAGNLCFVMSLLCFNCCFVEHCLFTARNVRLNRDRRVCVKYVAACTFYLVLLLYVICIGQCKCECVFAHTLNDN